MLELRNPHSILAVLERRPKAVKSLRVQSEASGDAWDRVLETARRAGVSVRVGSADERRGPRRETERVGAGSANVEPPSPVPLEHLFSTEDARGLWLCWIRSRILRIWVRYFGWPVFLVCVGSY